MASQIKVDLPIMQETVSKYDSAKNALSEAIVQMKSAVDSVAWTGAAAEAFKQQFDQLYSNLKRSDEIMLDAENDLKNTMRILEAAESETKASSGRLDTGSSAALPI